MKKLALAVLVGLTLTGGALVAPLAYAAEPTACSAALRVQADLEAQIKAAEAADTSREDARRRHATARDAAIAGGVPVDDQTDAAADRLAAERDTATGDRLAEIERKLPLVQAAVAAQVAIGAGGTDVAALRVKLAAAVKAVADACKGRPDVVVYEDCDAVRNAGKAPLALDRPGYRAGLDADGDGLACEDVEGSPVVVDDDDDDEEAQVVIIDDDDDSTQVVVVPDAIDTGYAA